MSEDASVNSYYYSTHVTELWTQNMLATEINKLNCRKWRALCERYNRAGLQSPSITLVH